MKTASYPFMAWAIFICALRSVEACDWMAAYMIQGDNAYGYKRVEQLDNDVFGGAHLPLAPLPSCIVNSEWYNVTEDGDWKYHPATDPGECNIFGSHCDHCYGGYNCQGTDDDPSSPIYLDRFKVRWYYKNGEFFSFSGIEYPCLDAEGRPQLMPYLKCGALTAQAQAAGGADPATATAEARACADRDRVLAEPPEAIEARLSQKFCAPGGAGVGRAFVEQMLASLDASGDGDVSCAEWGIAKMIPTLEQLGGAYRGPARIPVPECPMTPKGLDALARYNVYLAGLSAATPARAGNATAGADALQGR